MAKDLSQMEDSNRCPNASIHDVSDPARRVLLRGGLGGAVAGLLGPLVGPLAGCAAGPAGPSASDMPRLGFKSVLPQMGDGLYVAEGYSATPMLMWGEPVGVPGQMPAFQADGGNSAAEQALQIGMHHDGMAYFPLDGSHRGLLAINHEYTDDGLLHRDGMATWNADKAAKSIAAHGVSVIEVEQREGRWAAVRPSRYARRITGATPMSLSGPAAGHALLRTAADAEGRRVLGTLNNCASGATPWGTYLTCEENFVFYFNGPEQPDAHQKRWGLSKDGRGYRWHEHEPRFDATRHPNEFNRFGWVVEIDPLDPTMTPVKRTALGRAAHEGATVATTRDGRAVVYMGEDAQFEYIYKFVSRDRIRDGGFAANRELLDHGTLYVARFDADGSGRWLALRHGQDGLDAAAGFADQGELLVKSRQASDHLGATKMDRPEWIAIDPANGEVYCTLTNNSRRGASGQPGVDAANPRANNSMGHIIRWKEQGDFDAERFQWNHFVLAGDPHNSRDEARGNIRGDSYGSPDGLWFDARGLLWIQTDAHATNMYKGDYLGVGSNQMLAADPRSGQTRRFLVGPVNCEITGITATPDGRTMFVNIQHPGESPSDRSDPKDPTRFSTWPSGQPGVRPRSATLAIRKNDGGVIGS
ncbi:MAG: PhoX family phosphatase [Burkholderiaceae bacterium]|nr:PhoX family phosphatase [Burkholderiaceae bacterium]